MLVIGLTEDKLVLARQGGVVLQKLVSVAPLVAGCAADRQALPLIVTGSGAQR